MASKVCMTVHAQPRGGLQSHLAHICLRCASNDSCNTRSIYIYTPQNCKLVALYIAIEAQWVENRF